MILDIVGKYPKLNLKKLEIYSLIHLTKRLKKHLGIQLLIIYVSAYIILYCMMKKIKKQIIN